MSAFPGSRRSIRRNHCRALGRKRPEAGVTMQLRRVANSAISYAAAYIVARRESYLTTGGELAEIYTSKLGKRYLRRRMLAVPSVGCDRTPLAQRAVTNHRIRLAQEHQRSCLRPGQSPNCISNSMPAPKLLPRTSSRNSRGQVTRVDSSMNSHSRPMRLR